MEKTITQLIFNKMAEIMFLNIEFWPRVLYPHFSLKLEKNANNH